MQQILKFTNISNIKRIPFRSDINGLRAIAVLSVLLYHADIEVVRGGWLGVDIFFVISGFLISNIVISELNENSFKFKDFYLRRIKRITPALFSTLILTFPFSYFLFTKKAFEEYLESLLASIFFYANYHFKNLDFYAAESTKVMPLLHTWSLAIEEQYYLIFPLFTFLTFKFFKKYYFFIVLSITALSVYLNMITQDVGKFYLLQFRIWELLTGVLLMIISSNLKIKNLEKIGFPLMLFPMFYFDDLWINDLEPKLFAIVGISLIIFSNNKNSFLTRFLNIKLISKIGLSSYSIYLLHQPIFAFYRTYVFRSKYIYFQEFSEYFDVLNDFSGNLTYNYKLYFRPTIFLVVTTLIIGFISYKKIEVKFSKINSILLMFTFITIYISFQIYSPTVFIDSLKSDIKITDETWGSNFNCIGKIDNLNDPIDNLDKCFIDNNKNKTLVILGDSSVPAIAKNLIKHNPNQLNLNYLFISINHKNFYENFSEFSSCNNCVYNWLIQNKNNTNILLSIEIHRCIEDEDSIYFSDCSLTNNREALFENILKLTDITTKLIFIEPFPTMIIGKPEPKDILSTVSGSKIKEMYLPYSDWVKNIPNTLSLIENLKAQSETINIFKASDVFCSDITDKCMVYENSVLYYVDPVHLSIEGGELLMNDLITYLNN